MNSSVILANPYLIYETDRARPDPIPVRVVDRGMFPDPQVIATSPVPAPSACLEPLDPRRALALKSLRPSPSSLFHELKAC